MKKTLLSTFAVLAVVVLIAPALYAHGPGYGMGYRGKGFAGPGPMWGSWMTEEQRSKWDELRKEFDTETAVLRQEVRQKRLELAAIMAGPAPDETKAIAKMKELSAAREKLAEKCIQFRIKNREAFKDMPGFRPGFGRGRGYRMGPGFGPGMMEHGPWRGPRGFHR
ncbi:MAG: periplasmic heavy metal sensor [Deltaproteobacteria bacterium]|nr:periplasmic heavy metal sensor [Deltaproteobacteria bacterium]MBW2307213.1 periplasmic heavy metal sensor [Deltaproteobacteria bacterium]